MFIKEEEIFYSATEELEKITGATTKITTKEFPSAQRFKVDITIEIQLNKKISTLMVKVMSELRSGFFEKLLLYRQKYGENWMLISQYIPMPLKNKLKLSKINYIETAGNCFIETEELYIFINDKKVAETRSPQEGKLWKTSGLKFLFTVLQCPDLLNEPYRKIAKTANIALGNVGLLLEELRKEGFLKDGVLNKEKILFIEGKDRLIQRWAEAFKGILRPKLLMGTFRFMKKEETANWRKLNSEGFKWGGENAGALLTNYLQPEQFTLYTKESKLKLMKELRIVPDPNGKIELFEQFWSDEIYNKFELNTVPPLLAYAELVTSYDSRNIETATRIKEQYLD